MHPLVLVLENQALVLVLNCVVYMYEKVNQTTNQTNGITHMLVKRIILKQLEVRKIPLCG